MSKRGKSKKIKRRKSEKRKKKRARRERGKRAREKREERARGKRKKETAKKKRRNNVRNDREENERRERNGTNKIVLCDRCVIPIVIAMQIHVIFPPRALSLGQSPAGAVHALRVVAGGRGFAESDGGPQNQRCRSDIEQGIRSGFDHKQKATGSCH